MTWEIAGATLTIMGLFVLAVIMACVCFLIVSATIDSRKRRRMRDKIPSDQSDV